MYDRVYQLKQQFPDLHIGINGGINNHSDALSHLNNVDEVMLGREVYANPYCLSQVDALYYSDQNADQTESSVLSREEVALRMIPYIQAHLESGGRVWHVARHMLGLFQGQPGGKVWRRHLSQHGVKGDVKASVVQDALEQMQAAREHARQFMAQHPANTHTE